MQILPETIRTEVTVQDDMVLVTQADESLNHDVSVVIPVDFLELFITNLRAAVKEGRKDA